MKRNRSLNTTNGLLAKIESSYVITCFGLHLWTSSGYNLVAYTIFCWCERANGVKQLKCEYISFGAISFY